MELKKYRYPIGIQTFRNIVEGKWRYIDKTGYAYRLAQEYTYVFLSRPRRFGKSLLVSTLHSYFAGERELFDGLEASRLETEWTKHPVLHFDISTAKHCNREGLLSELNYKLLGYEEIYGKGEGEENCNQRLTGLIRRAYEQTGQKVVVLIDEYDAPLLDVLDNEEMLEANRQVMRNFYSPLKACNPWLRFVFITGITKFSQLSIFSELNNLKNISMMSEYAGICGVTQEELEMQFGDDVDNYAARDSLSRERAIEELKKYYDGYHFSEESPDVYNPFSLINALDAGHAEPYWFSSGTPTYLIKQMRHFDVRPQDISQMEALRSDFDVPTESMTSITPLLYQSGYLTIKGYNRDEESYQLAIPNREVRSGLMNSLTSYVTDGGSPTPFSQCILSMQRAFLRDDMEKLMEGLRTFFSAIPYVDNAHKNPEGYYQSLLFVVFSMMCRYTDVEVRTPRGRADLVINSRNKVYVIEVKIDQTADTAVEQIDLRNYGERFLIEGKPIVRVGINFDSQVTRNITDWKVVE